MRIQNIFNFKAQTGGKAPITKPQAVCDDCPLPPNPYSGNDSTNPTDLYSQVSNFM